MTIKQKYKKQHDLFSLICKIIAANKANEAEIKYVSLVAAKKRIYSSKSTAKQGVRNMVSGDRYPVEVARTGVIRRTDLK